MFNLATSGNKDDAEYFVPVKWLYSVDEGSAANEVGLFRNKN
jgi:hypothetical protein